MKNKNDMYSFIFFALMGTLGCKNDIPAQPEPTVVSCGDTAIVNKLVGEWEWVYFLQNGVIRGVPITPESCQCRKKVIFRKDCTCEIYENDTLNIIYNYHVSYESRAYINITNRKRGNILFLPERNPIYYLDSNTLILGHSGTNSRQIDFIKKY